MIAVVAIVGSLLVGGVMWAFLVDPIRRALYNVQVARELEEAGIQRLLELEGLALSNEWRHNHA